MSKAKDKKDEVKKKKVTCPDCDGSGVGSPTGDDCGHCGGTGKV